MSRTLGTLLRHLTELLDGAIEDAYRVRGLNYRPRYTPIYRQLLTHGSLSIRELAAAAGISHSAASQTVAHMQKQGLVLRSPGADRRERKIVLTAKAKAINGDIERQWRATERAVSELETEIGCPLAKAIANAISALEHRPFGERLRPIIEDLEQEAQQLR